MTRWFKPSVSSTERYCRLAPLRHIAQLGQALQEMDSRMSSSPLGMMWLGRTSCSFGWHSCFLSQAA